MSIQLIPGALMVLQIPFVKESPRHLINKGKSKSFFAPVLYYPSTDQHISAAEEGLKNLCRLRNLPADHPYVQTEYAEMNAQVLYEQECFAGHGYWVILKDIFLVPSNRRRFFLAVMLFLFHKFTGTDSLNVRTFPSAF